MLSYIFPLLYVISFLHAGQYVSVGDKVRYYQHSPDLYFAMEHVTTEAQALLWHDLLGIMDTPSTSVSPPVMSHIQYMLDNQIMGVPGVRNRVSYGAGGPRTRCHHPQRHRSLYACLCSLRDEERAPWDLLRYDAAW